jgi:hypothetical protein
MPLRAPGLQPPSCRAASSDLFASPKYLSYQSPESGHCSSKTSPFSGGDLRQTSTTVVHLDSFWLPLAKLRRCSSLSSAGSTRGERERQCSSYWVLAVLAVYTDDPPC